MKTIVVLVLTVLALCPVKAQNLDKNIETFIKKGDTAFFRKDTLTGNYLLYSHINGKDVFLACARNSFEKGYLVRGIEKYIGHKHQWYTFKANLYYSKEAIRRIDSIYSTRPKYEDFNELDSIYTDSITMKFTFGFKKDVPHIEFKSNERYFSIRKIDTLGFILYEKKYESWIRCNDAPWVENHFLIFDNFFIPWMTKNQAKKSNHGVYLILHDVTNIKYKKSEFFVDPGILPRQ